jgi:seryl-tRNA synthetase
MSERKGAMRIPKILPKKVFRMFRKKEKVSDKVGSLGMPKDEISLKSRNEEDRDPPKYFRKPREEEEVKLTEVLGGLLQRLKSLDKERTNLVEEIERLGEEAEKEAEEMDKELSTLKEQAGALKEVLEEMRSRRRI